MNTSRVKKDPLNRLVSRMKNGDRAAAAALYDTLLPPVYDFFILHGGEVSVAEELSERMFLTLIETVAEFNEKESSATAWFWNLAHEVMTRYDSEWTNVLVPGRDMQETL